MESPDCTFGASSGRSSPVGHAPAERDARRVNISAVASLTRDPTGATSRPRLRSEGRCKTGRRDANPGAPRGDRP